MDPSSAIEFHLQKMDDNWKDLEYEQKLLDEEEAYWNSLLQEVDNW